MIICNEFNKFNNTGARMIDSTYHMRFKLIKNRIFGVKTSRFCDILRYSICKPLVFYRFYCMVVYHSWTRRHVIKPNRQNKILSIILSLQPTLLFQSYSATGHIRAGNLYEGCSNMNASSFSNIHEHIII